MIEAFSPKTNLIFICSPNNPTGNLMEREAVIEVIENFDGIVIIDEAYIDFASTPSFTEELQKYPNLVVLQTFSKAWGMAGLRVGTAFASPEIVALLNRVKPPYNISTTAQQILLEALDQKSQIDEWIKISKTEREALRIALLELDLVQTIYPSDANFLLAKVADAVGIYKSLVAKGIVVRDRSNVELCEGCLRITVGTADENRQLIAALRDFGSKLEVSII
ncbi:MAG: aminotransferase class I/II-fold pyridoxal phosphate-dependent enzyme, partial [Acidobacteriota bacterium]